MRLIPILSGRERKKLTAVQAPRYQKARKVEKGRMLDEFTSATGYNRTYASYVLSRLGKKLRVSRKKVVVGDARKSCGKRRRKKIYTSEVKKLEGNSLLPFFNGHTWSRVLALDKFNMIECVECLPRLPCREERLYQGAVPACLPREGYHLLHWG